jgi:hypothetical protein
MKNEYEQPKTKKGFAMKNRELFRFALTLLASSCFAVAQPSGTAEPSAAAEERPARLPESFTRGAASEPGAQNELPSTVSPGQQPRATSMQGSRGGGRTLREYPVAPGAGASAYSSSSSRTPAQPAPWPDSDLSNGIFEEEGNLNLDAAIKSYQNVIAQYDSQRQRAANAIFRLGESYRKLGRMEEAKVQYARILREFPDQVQLTKSSHRYLTGNAEPAMGGSQPPQFSQRLQSIVSRAEPSTRSGAAPGMPGSGGSGRAGGLGGGLGAGAGGFTFPRADLSGGGDSFGGGGGGFGMSGTGLPSSFAGGSGRSSDATSGQRTETQRELNRVKIQEMNANREIANLRNRINMMQKPDPETLPEQAATDARYQQLKSQYEAALLGEADGTSPRGTEGTKQALNKLRTWVQKIHLPELEASLAFAKRNHEELLQQAAELEAKVAQETKVRADEARAQAEKRNREQAEADQRSTDRPKPGQSR